MRDTRAGQNIPGILQKSETKTPPCELRFLKNALSVSFHRAVVFLKVSPDELETLGAHHAEILGL